MSEVKIQLETAFQLRKNLNYKDALQLYAPLWKKDPLLFNEWSGWSYALCLKENKEFENALEVCRALYVRYSGFQMIQQLYAGCIYHTQFGSKQQPPIQTLKKAIDAMIQLYPPQLPYSLTSKAIFKYVKALFEQNNFDVDEAESYLNKIDPDVLDKNTYQFKGSNGKSVELASPMEEWYSLMVKTKALKNNPTELIQILDLAKKLNLKWHYGNQVWFMRKEAFAYMQLGEHKKAEMLLRKVVANKQDWFLLSDLADVISDKNEAFEFYCKAMLAFGDLPKKIKVVEKIYHHLRQTDKKAALLHLRLYISIRNQEGWPISINMEKDWEESAEKINPPVSIAKQLKELEAFWKSAIGLVRKEGVIDKILPQFGSGFIKTKEGDTYYFSSKEASSIKGKTSIGIRVTFELAEGFDKKKNVKTQNAVRIKVKD